ncbi:MAG: molybdenum cofactor guanylyltransferase [Rhodocyclaceae bacterium]|nr:molybdenum cofactor guanylyltransferase [Rhodocyclaceae bacterium]
MANTSRSAHWSPPERAALTGLILAGGEGRRMGGADKGLQGFQGQTLVASVLACLTVQVSTVLISANRNRAAYGRFGYPVITDAEIYRGEGYAGPLAGLHAGLTRCTTEWLLCVPCDTPCLPTDLAVRLAAGRQGAPLAVATCQGDSQPTVCLIHATLLASLGNFLAAGERKVRAWQARVGAVSVNFDDPRQFANFNTLQSLTNFVEAQT